MPSIIRNFAHRTCKGFIPGNPSKVNQDSMIEFTTLGLHTDISLFAVCDGHGAHGHDVSGFVKHKFPIILS